jgi:TolB-like protein
LTALLLVLWVALAPALAGPNTLAVMYFENQGNPDLEPLKVGLAQMMITDLKATSGVTLVERAQLQAILDELDLGHSGRVDAATAANVGRLLGAEWILLGTYFELMGTLRIDARLVRVETGEVLFADGLNDRKEAFLSMEKLLSASFRDALVAVSGPAGLRAPAEPARAPPAEPTSQPLSAVAPGATAAVVVPPDDQAIEAAIAFSEGLMALDRQDVPRAREAFQQAIAADSHLEAARAELAALEL